MDALKVDLKYIYALLKVARRSLGRATTSTSIAIDFCSFGNSMPFRIRIVNGFNENPDYFYIKKADASRVYGLELEHLLSPNRLNYVTHGYDPGRGARRRRAGRRLQRAAGWTTTSSSRSASPRSW